MNITQTQASVLSYELRRNVFARSKAMGCVVEALADDPPVLGSLLDIDDLEGEMVFRSKSDGTNRPGWHGTPRLVAARTSMVQGLEDAYFEKANAFDNNPCFWIVIRNDVDFGVRRVPMSEAIASRKEALDTLARENGRFLAAIDLRHFFRDVTPDHAFRILGSEGVGISPTLVDAVCVDIERNHGLMQSSYISDLIARLLLTPLDQYCADRGLPVVRFQDDVYVLGNDEIQAGLRSLGIQKFIVEELGFSVNQGKTCVEPESRFAWGRWGTVWAGLPIEEYDRELNREKLDAYFTGGGYPGRSSYRFDPSLLADSGVDWRTIYRTHHGPNGTGLSHATRRLTLAAMGVLDPRVVEEDATLLVARNASDIPSILGGLDEPDGAAAKCFHAVPTRASSEDDRLQAIEGCVGTGSTQLVNDWRRQSDGILLRAARQGILAVLPPEDESLLTASSFMTRDIWADGIAAILKLAAMVPGRASRTMRDVLVGFEPKFGIIAEVFGCG